MYLSVVEEAHDAAEEAAKFKLDLIQQLEQAYKQDRAGFDQVLKDEIRRFRPGGPGVTAPFSQDKKGHK